MGPKLKACLALLAIASLAMGSYGIFLALSEQPGASHWELRLIEAIYISIQLFTFNFPDFLFYDDYQGAHRYNEIHWTLQVARFSAPFVTVTTAISLVAQRLESWLKRKRVRLFYRRHVIVYGYNLRARLFVEDLKQRGEKKVIIVDPNLDEQDVAAIAKLNYLSFTIDGADPSVPALCKAERARYLFALYDDDSLNMRILVRAYHRNTLKCKNLNEAQQDKDRTQCFIHFSDSAFRRIQFGQQFRGIPHYFEAHIFSLHNHLAKLLAQTIYKKHAATFATTKRLDLYVVGLNRTGLSVVEQLIRLSYFSEDCPIRITLLDDDEKNWENLLAKFPVLDPDLRNYSEEDRERLAVLRENVQLPELRFEKISYQSPTIAGGQLMRAEAEGISTRIGIICLADATRSLAIAETILQQKHNLFEEVLVRADDPDSEIRDHVRSELMASGQLSLFPPLESICKVDTVLDTPIDTLAQIIHAEYQRELQSQGESSFHLSREDWLKLPEQYKEANRQAALHLEIKCCLLGHCGLDVEQGKGLSLVAGQMRSSLLRPEESHNLERLAACEHNRWCVDRLLENWIPGPERHEGQRRHPDLVPWRYDTALFSAQFAGFKELDEPTRQKDRNTIVKIPSLLDQLEQRLPG